VGDDWHEARFLPDGDRLADAGLRAVVRLWRQAIVIREIRAPVFRRLDNADDLLDLGEVRRLIVETGGDAPGAGLEPTHDDRAHALDLVRRRAPVGGAHYLRPGAVEPDVGADIERQARGAGARELLRQVDTSAAVGVQDFRRDSLREHVLSGRQCIDRRVAMDIDEAWRHEQARRVDFLRRARVAEVAHARDEPVRNPHVRPIAGKAGAINDSAAADDQIEPRRLCADKDTEENRGHQGRHEDHPP
jgi:hypothetical protein